MESPIIIDNTNKHEIIQYIPKEIIKEEVNSNECGICMDAPIECALNCGHMLCASCVKSMNKCPFCRKIPTSAIKLFFLTIIMILYNLCKLYNLYKILTCCVDNRIIIDVFSSFEKI